MCSVGFLVGYATSAGKPAEEYADERNAPYTGALLHVLRFRDHADTMGDVLVAANARVAGRPDVTQVAGLFNYLRDLGPAAFFCSVHGLLPIQEPCEDDAPVRVRDVAMKLLEAYGVMVRFFFGTLHTCCHSRRVMLCGGCGRY